MAKAVLVTAGLLLLLARAAARPDWEYSGKVLLVSMDGFRWDYVNKVSGLDNFRRLAASGVTVDYVVNTFVTKTFPCHYSIATGLYEESHGIVANRMYDPEHDAYFSMKSKESFWWDGGEPIWVTAVKQGKRAATYYWPGSESEIRGHRPTFYRPYNQSVPFPERVQTALGWFTDNDVHLVTLYFHEPDSTGHTYGPDSPQIANKVQEMDGILGLILDTMDEKNLTDVVNVIVTSDHGMTAIDMQNKILDFWASVSPSMVDQVVDSGPVTAILPAAGREDDLVAALKQLDHVTVYRKEEIPEEFHYRNSPRVMPVLVVADEGWTLSVNVTSDQSTKEKGNHGYSNALKSMHPIFFARGPDFRVGEKLTSIRSIDLYPLMCQLLDIQAAPNNGSLDNTRAFLKSSHTNSAVIMNRNSVLMSVWIILSFWLV